MADQRTNSSRGRPQYGRRLLTSILDQLAADEPDHVYASMARGPRLEDGFRDFRVGEIAHAVDVVAHHLHHLLGPSKPRATIAYLGGPDLRYTVMLHASVKCGFKIFFPNPRNTTKVNLSLLKECSCASIFYSSEAIPMLRKLQGACAMLKAYGIEPLELLISKPAEKYRYLEQFDQARDATIVILHSSGSTGRPKTVSLTHGAFATLDADNTREAILGHEMHDFTIWNEIANERFHTIFPPFHLAGFVSATVIPLFVRAIPVLGPPVPPDVRIVRQVMEQQDIKALFVPPVFVEGILGEPNGFDLVCRLRFLCYAGGPLSRPAGERVSQVTHLCQYFGATETLQVPQVLPPRDDWEYMQWDPRCDLEMRPYSSTDGIFELVLLNRTDPAIQLATFRIFPELREFATRDLFCRHPNNPKLWKFYGRRDDIIVLSSSEKLNPLLLEAIIQENPIVAAAMVVGQGRPRTALLIEPAQPIDNVSGFLETLWPTIEAANAAAPQFGRIVRSMVITTHREKPLCRAIKGTTIRKDSEAQYIDEIEELFKNAPQAEQRCAPALNLPFTENNVLGLVKRAISQCCQISDASGDDELLALGLDSLKAIELVNFLRGALRDFCHQSGSLEWLSPQALYEAGNSSGIAHQIYRNLKSVEAAPACRDDESEHEDHARLEKMVARAESSLKALIGCKAVVKTPVVALIGSTGWVGRHILQSLLCDSNIAHVYCLDRRKNARQHLEKFFRASLDPFSTKLSFHQVELATKHLGITDELYQRLLLDVDYIIHGAWKVNFNHPLETFDAELLSLQHVIEWCATSIHRPRLLFLSSLSAVAEWHHAQDAGFKVPEAVPKSYQAAIPIGYAQSKLVAEKILENASEAFNIAVSVLRIGQICGGMRLAEEPWPIHEWVPAIIKSSITLGLIPNGLTDVDWVPVDAIGQVVKDLMLIQNDKQFRVHNVLSSKKTAWKDVIEPIKREAGEDTKVVSLSEWIEEIEKWSSDPRMRARDLPAVSLLPWIRALKARLVGDVHKVEFETKDTIAASKALQTLPPIQEEQMKLWIAQWNFNTVVGD